jgi:hypothetical protein
MEIYQGVGEKRVANIFVLLQLPTRLIQVRLAAWADDDNYLSNSLKAFHV